MPGAPAVVFQIFSQSTPVPARHHTGIINVGNPIEIAKDAQAYSALSKATEAAARAFSTNRHPEGSHFFHILRQIHGF
jgi:hypothetical protein